ncbi:MAG: penicillin-binding protein, partial [Rhodobacteraceae bacterium]|nr:penicillin-binding protein [Paracoccaceae bacterium]
SSDFAIPPDTVFIKFDRFSGARLPSDARGPHVVAELFRRGEEPQYGIFSIIDGGFAMGEDLELFDRGEGDGGDQVVTTASGKKKKIPKKASFGSLSSGGLY